METHLGHNAIRRLGIGFKEEQSRYETQLTAAGQLPEEMKMLQHAISWPVDISNPLVHITAYFDQPNYSDPGYDGKHKGIDIQLPEGTPIVSPEEATVVIVRTDRINTDREMADIMLYSEKSGLAYWLVHLDVHSLPKELLKRSYFDKWSETKVHEGEVLGKVGLFFNDYMKKRGKGGLMNSVVIPEDVLKNYGRSYNHLHFETHFQPDIYSLGIDVQKNLT